MQNRNSGEGGDAENAQDDNHNKLCGRRWFGRHGMPPPACNNPTAQTFIAGHGS